MTAVRDASPAHFSDDFDGSDLDRDVWLAHYLPMWSSRARSAATYAVHARGTLVCLCTRSL